MMYRHSLQFLWRFMLAAILLCSAEAGMAATFVVTNTADSGAGSLRQAIDAANSLPGADLIAFNIPGAGAHIIAPASDLPAITGETTIDGSTQPGYLGTPLISVSGTAGATGTGLILNPGNCAVRGLAVNGFPIAGVVIYGSSNVVTGCFIGTDETGTIPRPNGNGLFLEQNSANNTIGGSTADARNVISGNGTFGIIVFLSSSNTIQGNRIGTDLTGAIGLPNGSNGVFLAQSFDNNLGGTKPGEGNVISANFGTGIQIDGGTSSNNVIQGNIVGLDLTGSVTLGNSAGGIEIRDAPGNTVGGVDPGARNIISGNRGNGILIQAASAVGNVIEGNIIGLNSGGSVPLPNQANGVQVLNSTGNTIGGAEAGAANLISGNSFFGIDLGGSSNVVQGNFIGTDANGAVALANGTRIPSGGGVRVSGMNQDVGGDSIAARNLISGNLGNGIVLEGAIGCVVQANWVGVDSTGKPLGNTGSGIVLWFGSQANTIGGSASGQGNIFAGNGANGLLLNGLGTDANVCIGNHIGSTPDGHPRPNALAGISIREGASLNAIGGPNPGEGNIVSGNAGPGIAISNSGTSNNALQGNSIGTDESGRSIGNQGAGVEVSGTATDDLVGGTNPGEANRIAFNKGGGVLVRDVATGITISGNSIFSNGGLAINLQPPGEAANKITPNDPLDADTGPNHLQNSPVITNTTYAFGLMLVSGYLLSTPDSDFQIELFQNEPYGNFLFGEGQTFLGALGVSTDGSGLATFQFSLAGGFTNELFAATATDLGTGDTSEFSPAIPIQHGVLRIVDVVRAGAETKVSFTTEAGIHYALRSTDTLPAVSWDLVPGASDVTGTGNLVTVSDAGAGAQSQRFYRVQEIP